MPICISCTHPVPYLYTIYASKHNLRLEKCPSCHEFVDPYVEHDSLTILLDLILLKRGVYRHLLFNRGADPRRSVGENTKKNTIETTRSNAERARWLLLLQLGTCLVALDAYGATLVRRKITCVVLQSEQERIDPSVNAQTKPWTQAAIPTFFRFFLGTAAETIAFHGGITFSCYTIMKTLNWFKSSPSNIQQEFRLSRIPLSLFYSSLTKLLLLLLLTIWLPTSAPPPNRLDPTLPSWVSHLTGGKNGIAKGLFQLLDDDKLDREWIIRNILGGMSAGFGLRVILDMHPLFTTMIILIGWAAKNAAASFVSGWVGGDATASEAWRAYSIP